MPTRWKRLKVPAPRPDPEPSPQHANSPVPAGSSPLNAAGDRAFSRLAKVACGTLKSELVLLALGEGETLRIVSSAGNRGEYQPLVDHLWQAVRQSMLSGRAASSPVEAPGSHPVTASANGLSAVAVPLIDGDGYLHGMLAAADSASRHWSPDDYELMRVFAGSAVAELDRCELTAQRRLQAELRATVESDLRRISGEAGCLLWKAGVRETGQPRLAWTVRALDEEAAQRFLPLDLAPGQTYLNAWYHARLPEDRIRTDRYGVGEVRAGRSYSQEFRCRRRDGAVRWLHEQVWVEPVGPGAWEAVGVCTDITERKEAEEALHALAANARCLMWHADVRDRGGPCLEWEQSLLYPEVSQSFLELETDTTASYLELWAQSLLPEDRAAREALAERSLRAGKSYACEFRCRDRNGNVLWMQEQVQVDRITSGCWHAVGVVSDITREKAAEETLRWSEERVRLVLDAAGVHLWEIDVANGEVSWSENAETTYGLPSGSFGGTHAEFLALVHPEDRHLVDVPPPGVELARDEFTNEFRILRPDGTVRWMLGRGRLLRDKEGRPLRIVGVGMDVTEARAVEAALRESEERLRLAIEATDQMVWTWDLAGGATRDKTAAGRLLGYAPEEIEDTMEWWTARIHPEDRKEVLSRIETALQGEESRLSLEYRMHRRDGSYATVLAHAQVVRDAAGVPERILGSTMDVSEHRALEAQLRQAQKMEAVGRLAGGIAHDFNNLLSVINGYSSLLSQLLPRSSTEHAHVMQILEAGQRAAGLTRQLLTFSRKQVIDLQVLDVGRVVRNLASILRPMIGEDVQIVLEVASEPLRVRADRGQLEQAVMNLVVNARDAMSRGGQVTLSVARADTAPAVVPSGDRRAPGKWIELCVSDTGCGMTSETQSRVFEPFFTTKDVGKGTGLGLSTVYGVIQQFAGSIEVESELGAGSTFRILLPAVEDEPEIAEAPAAALPGGAETVLLVEDEASVLRLAMHILQAHGYRVISATSGEEALALITASNRSIDLLLSDVVMRGMTGGELAEEFRRLHPVVPVVFMTGYTDDALVQRGVDSGSIHLLHKPFTPDGLLQAVRTALSRRETV